MNGIGNAFIWFAIGCGPVFLLILGLMTIFLPARRPGARVTRVPVRLAHHAKQARRPFDRADPR